MPEETSPRDMIRIAHPDVDAIGGPVTRKAFDEVWSPKGWTEVDPLVAAANEATVIDEPVTDLNSLTKEKLTALAHERGVSVDPSDSKQTLIDKLRATV